MHSEKCIEFTTNVKRLEHLLKMHYLEIPAKVIKSLGGKLNVRLICTVNNSLSFQCGMVALGNGKAYISVNAKRMKELGIKESDKVKLNLSVDPSKYGMEVPPELMELFRQDKEGKRRFEALSPGKQRYIIYYVSGVKSSQLRIDRALFLIGNLKNLPKGNESFREILGKT
jgi:hypothetical protein